MNGSTYTVVTSALSRLIVNVFVFCGVAAVTALSLASSMVVFVISARAAVSSMFCAVSAAEAFSGLV